MRNFTSRVLVGPLLYGTSTYMCISVILMRHCEP